MKSTIVTRALIFLGTCFPLLLAYAFPAKADAFGLAGVISAYVVAALTALGIFFLEATRIGVGQDKVEDYKNGANILDKDPLGRSGIIFFALNWGLFAVLLLSLNHIVPVAVLAAAAFVSILSLGRLKRIVTIARLNPRAYYKIAKYRDSEAQKGWTEAKDKSQATRT